MLAQRMLAFSAVLAVVVLSTCSIMRAPYWGIGVSFVAVSGFIEQGGVLFIVRRLSKVWVLVIPSRWRNLP